MCVCVCYFGLILRAEHAPATEAMEAESSGPEMQVMDPHGAGLVFRNYTRAFLSLRTAALCSLSLHFSLSLAGKQFGAEAFGFFEKVNSKGRYMM